MAREPYYQHDGEDYYVGIADASGEVAEAPTVDAVEVVHGRWKDKQTNSIFTWRLECSVCGAEYNTPAGYNYCPNCGAKMDGEKNNEN